MTYLEALRRVRECLINFRPGDSIYICDNLSYIGALIENHFSYETWLRYTHPETYKKMAILAEKYDRYHPRHPFREGRIQWLTHLIEVEEGK